MHYNVDISTLDTILRMRYNDKQVNLIKGFLLEFIDKDINVGDDEKNEFNDKTNYSIDLIIESGVVIGIKIIYTPTRVLPEENYYSSSEDYKACCRRVLFNDDRGFVLESCDVDFDIFTSAKFNHQLQYSIEIDRQVARRIWQGVPTLSV